MSKTIDEVHSTMAALLGQDVGLPLNGEKTVFLKRNSQAGTFELIKRISQPGDDDHPAYDTLQWLTNDEARALVDSKRPSLKVDVGNIHLSPEQAHVAHAYLRTFVECSNPLWSKFRLIILPLFRVGDPVYRLFEAIVKWIVDTVNATLRNFTTGFLSRASKMAYIGKFFLVVNIIVTVLLLFWNAIYHFAVKLMDLKNESQQLADLKANQELQRLVAQATTLVTAKVGTSYLSSASWDISDRIGVEFKAGHVIPFRRYGGTSAPKSQQLWMGKVCRHMAFCSTATEEATLKQAIVAPAATIASVGEALDRVTTIPSNKSTLKRAWPILKQHVAAHLLLRHLTMGSADASHAKAQIVAFVCGELTAGADRLYEGKDAPLRSALAAFIWNPLEVSCLANDAPNFAEQKHMATTVIGAASAALDHMKRTHDKKHFMESSFSECNDENPDACHTDETLLAVLLRYQNVLCLLERPGPFKLREASPATSHGGAPTSVPSQ